MNYAVKLDPAIGGLIVGCFAVLFLSGASHKLRDMRRFAEVLAAYKLASAINRWQPSWLVPLFELGVGFGLLLPRSRTTAAAVGICLLLGYGISIAVNLRAGNDAIACGCGGPDERRPIAAWMVWRNLLLAGVLATAMLPWNGRALEWTDAATIGCGLLAIALLYSCVERLFGEFGRVRSADGTR